MNCPKCMRPLVKIKEHGEAVKFCEACKCSWFIVLCRQHQERK